MTKLSPTLRGSPGQDSELGQAAEKLVFLTKQLCWKRSTPCIFAQYFSLSLDHSSLDQLIDHTLGKILHFLWKVTLCSDPALAWKFRYSSFHSAGSLEGKSVKVKYTFLQTHSSRPHGSRERGREREKSSPSLCFSLVRSFTVV